MQQYTPPFQNKYNEILCDFNLTSLTKSRGKREKIMTNISVAGSLTEWGGIILYYKQ